MCCPSVEDDHIKLPRSKKCLIFAKWCEKTSRGDGITLPGPVSCVQGSLVSLITEIGGIRFGMSLA